MQRHSYIYTAVWCLKKQLSVRRSRLCEGENPPRRSGEGTLGVYAMLAHTLTSPQPFKMPRYNHTSVKIGSECMICKRESRALNLHWLPEQKVMSGVFIMEESLIMGYNSSSGSESLTWKWTITERILLPFKSRGHLTVIFSYLATFVTVILVLQAGNMHMGPFWCQGRDRLVLYLLACVHMADWEFLSPFAQKNS